MKSHKSEYIIKSYHNIYIICFLKLFKIESRLIYYGEMITYSPIDCV